MSQRILDIFRQSGDEHLGQTLVRLAQLAAVAHRVQAAEAAAGAVKPSALSLHQVSVVGAEGLGPQVVVRPAGREANDGRHRTHEEVDR